jgi:hypothetical protein
MFRQKQDDFSRAKHPPLDLAELLMAPLLLQRQEEQMR